MKDTKFGIIGIFTAVIIIFLLMGALQSLTQSGEELVYTQNFIFSDDLTDNETEWTSGYNSTYAGVPLGLNLDDDTWFVSLTPDIYHGSHYNLTAGYTYSSFVLPDNFTIEIFIRGDQKTAPTIYNYKRQKFGLHNDPDIIQGVANEGIYVDYDANLIQIFFNNTLYWRDAVLSDNGNKLINQTVKICYNCNDDDMFNVWLDDVLQTPSYASVNISIRNFTVNYIGLESFDPINAGYPDNIPDGFDYITIHTLDYEYAVSGTSRLLFLLIPLILIIVVVFWIMTNKFGVK